MRALPPDALSRAGAFMITEPPAALRCRNISVRYGDFAALTDVSVAFAPNLIHAVVGQNGAGKTTFARVVAGIVKPVSGTLEIDGLDVAPGHVNRSRAAGVELVHQSFALPPSFTVAEAMEFGARGRGSIFSRRKLEARWTAHLENLGVQARLKDRIRDLPVESQQSVEIARALVANARLLILDEPTAVLSPSGVEALFERLKGLKASGVVILLVLHKIREVLAVADTVTVLRGGRLIEGPVAANTVDARELSAAIIGAEAEKTLTARDEEALVGSDLPAGARSVAAAKAEARAILFRRSCFDPAGCGGAGARRGQSRHCAGRDRRRGGRRRERAADPRARAHGSRRNRVRATFG